MPVKFDASVVLSPVSDDSAASKLGGAGALLSQVGGLGALGGFSLGGGGKKAESVATLGSAALTEEFIKDNNLLPVLYYKKWDAEKQDWKSDDPDERPTLWKAEKKFREKVRSIDEDKKTGLITLTITWRNPEQAAAWANELVQRANRKLRDRAIERSQRNLDYLNEQLAKSNVVELQKAISSLIENEIKQVMVARGNDDFAFRVIDPARVPGERSSPKRGVIAVLGLVLGFVFGVILALALPAKSR
jgi:hypothetical protein